MHFSFHLDLGDIVEVIITYHMDIFQCFHRAQYGKGIHICDLYQSETNFHPPLCVVVCEQSHRDILTQLSLCLHVHLFLVATLVLLPL